MTDAIVGRLRVLGSAPGSGARVVSVGPGAPPMLLHPTAAAGRFGPLWVDGRPAWLAPMDDTLGLDELLEAGPLGAEAEAELVRLLGAAPGATDTAGLRLDRAGRVAEGPGAPALAARVAEVLGPPYDPGHPDTGRELEVGVLGPSAPPRVRVAAFAALALVLGLAAGGLLARPSAGDASIRVPAALSASLTCPGLRTTQARDVSGDLWLRGPSSPASCTLGVDLDGGTAVSADVALAPGRSYICTVSTGTPGSLSCDTR